MFKPISLITVVLSLAGVYFLCGCERISDPPIPTLVIYPPIGDSTTLFELNALESTDDRSLLPTLEYRWDFDGDGIWDTDFGSQGVQLKNFSEPRSYLISVEVKDEDEQVSAISEELEVFGRNKDVGSIIDIRDGKSYKTVKIGDDWWMAENLAVGAPIDPIAEDLADNQKIEHYYLWSYSYQRFCYAYSWAEANNHDLSRSQGICPDGWHLPNELEWQSLYSRFPWFFTFKYYGSNGLSGIDLGAGHQFAISRTDSLVFHADSVASFWSRDQRISEEGRTYAGMFAFNVRLGTSFMDEIYLDFEDDTQIVSSVRCIKDKVRPEAQ
ncbi:MAG: hypothetical protein HN686_06015 [Bacteroidetes bacterium]|jgi:uncharacterized protein (TIGR02145 family)|nr:hypothetical protein [Bacteroidota bacterium]MBT7463516.1 hypothetical protein [Bacteroidota bacterium]